MHSTEKIWHDYNRKLSGFIRSRVPEDIADDVLQDVFLKIQKKIGSLNDTKKLESWLYQITRNTIIDHYRSHRLIEEIPPWLESQDQDKEDEDLLSLTRCLEPMITELPDKYRRVLELSFIQGKKLREIAELEGISLSGAKSRLQRGRAMLKEMLVRCCSIEFDENQQIISMDSESNNCSGCS